VSDFVILGKTLFGDQAIESWFIFSPHLIGVSALPAKINKRTQNSHLFIRMASRKKKISNFALQQWIVSR